MVSCFIIGPNDKAPARSKGDDGIFDCGSESDIDYDALSPEEKLELEKMNDRYVEMVK